MSNLPIACSLSRENLAAVKERYRAATSHYRATARISDNHAEISLTGDKTAIRDLLTEMIERENACCPFLSFIVTESSAGYDVQLTVLDGAGLEDDILRESVDTLFPGSTSIDAAGGLLSVQGAFAGLRPFPGRHVEREAAIQEAVREALDLPES